MREQHLLSEGRLLNENGGLAEAGYATSLVKQYARADVKAGKSRIKEWDYYYFGDDAFGVALTIADNSYMSLVSASLMDFERGTYVTDSEIRFFSGGKLCLPSTSASGSVRYHGGRVDMAFENGEAGRRLACAFRKWGPQKADFAAEFAVTGGEGDSMVIATPFEKPRHFYYNQKINCLQAEGWFSVGGERRALAGLGVLDWGRGVWTYRNTWYWGSLSCRSECGAFGFNLGYGFGDTLAATENMLFLNGKAFKLGDVAFDIPKDKRGKEAYLSEWRIADADGLLDLTFRPILDRSDKTSVGVIASDQHQVFGRFYGTAQCGGVSVPLNGQIGFAEKVYNKW